MRSSPTLIGSRSISRNILHHWSLPVERSTPPTPSTLDHLMRKTPKESRYVCACVRRVLQCTVHYNWQCQLLHCTAEQWCITCAVEWHMVTSQVWHTSSQVWHTSLQVWHCHITGMTLHTSPHRYDIPRHRYDIVTSQVWHCRHLTGMTYLVTGMTLSHHRYDIAVTSQVWHHTSSQVWHCHITGITLHTSPHRYDDIAVTSQVWHTSSQVPQCRALGDME